MHQAIPEQNISLIVSSLTDWFKKNQRLLPWRSNYAPYEIWISEVILQQTQMERGISYFTRWMTRFPSVADVASASDEEIMRYWEGLGYYRRAKMLHKAAKVIVQEHHGRIPSTREELLSLPGLGEYTAAAILGIAYEQDIATIDANVERVFSRLLDIDTPVKKSPAASLIRREAQKMLPHGNARIYNQALMELGALVCKKRPLCSNCPISAWCAAYRRGVAALRPVLGPRSQPETGIAVHGVLMSGDHVLLVQRPQTGLWGGMWEFPGGRASCTDLKAELSQKFSDLGCDVEIIAPLGSVFHTYTNHRMTAYFFRVSSSYDRTWQEISLHLKNVPHCFVHWSRLKDFAMPSHHRKIASRYFFSRRQHIEQLTLQEGA